MQKVKRTYDLEYIEKIFKLIPLGFILLLCIISIFITFLVIESKQKRDIDLLVQKNSLYNEFDKKKQLIEFDTKVKKNVSEKLDQTNKFLQETTYKVIGSMENYNGILDNPKIKELLQVFEKQSSLEIILFKIKDLHILYGKEQIEYLSQLIFGKSDQHYTNIVLQYLFSQGKNNLQHWKNNLTGELRVSFFDKLFLKNEEYVIGSFSKTINIRQLLKTSIIEQINQLKHDTKCHIWFYDQIENSVYNFYNKKTFIESKQILNTPSDTKSYQQLLYFSQNEHLTKKYDNYVIFNDRYRFLMAIEYDYTPSIDIQEIKESYTTLFFTIVFYILFVTAILILSSLIFSNFSKKILKRYNKRLQGKTKLLSHWKNRFELAIIASNDGLWDIDFETQQIYFSDKWLEISGYQKGEIKKFSDWFALIHKDDREKVELLFEEIFNKKRDALVCEYRLKTKTEGFKWILARGKLFEQNHKKRMLMMSMDIDIDKKLKQELLDVELLVEDGKIVLFKLFNDTKLNIKYISNSIKNFGFEKQSFQKGQRCFYDLLFKEDINSVQAAINAALHQDLKDFHFVSRVVDAQNKIKWVSCRVLPLKNHSNEVIYFYGYMNDITKIKLSQEQLEHKVKEEVVKNREKDRLLIQQSKMAAMGEMLGNIAHQWRQPLNNVNLFLNFIKDNYQNETVPQELLKRYFDKSFTQINYMSQTIDDFRNFYKLSKEKTTFTLSHAITSTLDIINAQLKAENIKIILNLEDDIEIYSFENELKQAILNILSNAKDALSSKKETIEFEAKIEITIIKSLETLHIKICNNGEKIDQTILSKIFEPYFTTKFEAQGTGIGLYMTKSIIENNMQGSISVENSSDGVCFTIELPITKKEESHE